MQAPHGAAAGGAPVPVGAAIRFRRRSRLPLCRAEQPAEGVIMSEFEHWFGAIAAASLAGVLTLSLSRWLVG